MPLTAGLVLWFDTMEFPPVCRWEMDMMQPETFNFRVETLSHDAVNAVVTLQH